MESAPAAIPVTIAATLPAGFAPVDGIGAFVISTFSPTNSDRPARSAKAITGTSPAHDTRFSSSKHTAARDHLCNNLTESAFRSMRQSGFSNSDYRRPEGTFLVNALHSATHHRWIKAGVGQAHRRDRRGDQARIERRTRCSPQTCQVQLGAKVAAAPKAAMSA
jgi:hypothetical protein